MPTKYLIKFINFDSFYWPGIKTDVEKHLRQCEKKPTTFWTPTNHGYSVVDWKISNPFHHFGLGFFSLLLPSKSCRYMLLIGDRFTKWYEATSLQAIQQSQQMRLSWKGEPVFLPAHIAFTHTVEPILYPNFLRSF